VRIIPNKVIVCGHFEVKALYVACLPGQPVHAVEIRRVRFTADIPIWGALCGMDADASVFIEFVDYDCPHHHHHHHHHRGKYHYGKGMDCDDDCGDGHHHHDCDDDHHHGHDGPWCKPKCAPADHHHDCDDDHHHGHDGPWCKPECAPADHHHHDNGFREFDVTVVLRVVAKVLTDREIVIYPGQFPGLPPKPKG
jgi:hypothetical protein